MRGQNTTCYIKLSTSTTLTSDMRWKRRFVRKVQYIPIQEQSFFTGQLQEITQKHAHFLCTSVVFPIRERGESERERERHCFAECEVQSQSRKGSDGSLLSWATFRPSLGMTLVTLVSFHVNT